MCHTQALTVRAPLILSSPLGGGLPENFHSLLYLQSQHNAWNTSRFYEKTSFTTKSWHSKHRKLQPYRYHQNLAGWDSTVICKHWSPNTWQVMKFRKNSTLFQINKFIQSLTESLLHVRPVQYPEKRETLPLLSPREVFTPWWSRQIICPIQWQRMRGKHTVRNMLASPFLEKGTPQTLQLSPTSTQGKIPEQMIKRGFVGTEKRMRWMVRTSTWTWVSHTWLMSRSWFDS